MTYTELAEKIEAIIEAAKGEIKAALSEGFDVKLTGAKVKAVVEKLAATEVEKAPAQASAPSNVVPITAAEKWKIQVRNNQDFIHVQAQKEGDYDYRKALIPASYEQRAVISAALESATLGQGASYSMSSGSSTRYLVVQRDTANPLAIVLPDGQLVTLPPNFFATVAPTPEEDDSNNGDGGSNENTYN